MTRRGRLKRVIRAADGPLSTELARAPGGFGLGQVPASRVPDSMTTMVCGFCSTGCALDVHLRHGEAVNLTPSSSYPVNKGSACPKGWEALAPLDAPDRATAPMVRRKGGPLEPVSWPEALALFTERFQAVQAAHGPESVAFLSTGQIPTEEMALLGAVAKFGMGLVHGDGNTRQCMATSVAAHKESFGFDAPPYTYADLEESDVIVLVGSNLCIAHPILWERIARNPHHPEVIVVDPRLTETAAVATQHYAARPKSDLALLYGLAHLLLERGAVDQRFIAEHTTGFEAFVDHVAAFTPDRVAADTGLSLDQLERFAATIAAGERVSFWWTMGVNQSHQGVRTAQAIIDLALLTGNIGRPGTGANSITGQCNAMGSRLFSNTTNLFGGREFTNAEHRREVGGILGIDAGLIPDRPSLAYDQIIEGIHRGTIHGLWIVATNSAHSWINQTEVRELLGQLDFLVVQDLYTTTETAELADLVLPAAGWGEKEGTFINSERRIGRIRRVRRAPGQALTDFAIVKLIAAAWGCGELFQQWDTPEDVFRILARLSAGRPCDFSGIETYAQLDDGGLQWPYPASLPDSSTDSSTGMPAEQRQTERRLFADGQFFTPDGRARFVVEDPVPEPERPSRHYPLSLLTGRGSSAQWHTGTRTSKSAVLRALAPDVAYVEIAPGDAAELGIQASDRVVVESARGSMRARALVAATVPVGHVFVPMHDAATNRLTFPAFDPISRQPSYKSGAVLVRRLHSWET